jgi:hypothetical protein
MRWPACAEVILGVNFDPGGRRPPLRRIEHVGIVPGSKPYAGTRRQRV